MSSKVTCKYHPDAPLIEDYRAGDTICSDCGIVVGDRYISSSDSGIVVGEGKVLVPTGV